MSIDLDLSRQFWHDGVTCTHEDGGEVGLVKVARVPRRAQQPAATAIRAAALISITTVVPTRLEASSGRRRDVQVCVTAASDASSCR